MSHNLGKTYFSHPFLSEMENKNKKKFILEIYI